MPKYNQLKLASLRASRSKTPAENQPPVLLPVSPETGDKLYTFWKERALAAERKYHDIIEDLIQERARLRELITIGDGQRGPTKARIFMSTRLAVVNKLLRKLDIRQGL